mmetsp:Transcript_51648/g.136426  ORF Transcript_51648/g.136426 Transcript_51648/m.136426 type:complete len:235 (+) Transcript_51648:304-1008(+)
MSRSRSVTCSSSSATSAATVPSARGRRRTSGERPRSRSRMPSTSWARAASSTSASVAPMAMRARAIDLASLAMKPIPRASTASQIFGGTRPTMPKSMKPTRPSSSTRRLPACTSAWKNSHFCTDRAHVLSAATRVISGSSVYCLMPSRSTKGTPRSRDMVRTFLEVNSEKGTGTVATLSSPLSSMNLRKTTRFRASSSKSSSPSIEVRRSEAMSESEPRVLRSGLMKPSTRAAT